MPEESRQSESPVASRSPGARLFAVIVLSVFLVIWLTMTLGMAKMWIVMTPAPLSWLPVLFAIFGVILIGGSIVGILFAKPPASRVDSLSADPKAGSGDARPDSEQRVCTHCRVRMERSAVKCPACGAPSAP